MNSLFTYTHTKKIHFKWHTLPLHKNVSGLVWSGLASCVTIEPIPARGSCQPTDKQTNQNQTKPVSTVSKASNLLNDGRSINLYYICIKKYVAPSKRKQTINLRKFVFLSFAYTEFILKSMPPQSMFVDKQALEWFVFYNYKSSL